LGRQKYKLFCYLQVFFKLFSKKLFAINLLQYFKLFSLQQPLSEWPVLFGAAKVQTFLLLANKFQFILKLFASPLFISISTSSFKT